MGVTSMSYTKSHAKFLQVAFHQFSLGSFSDFLVLNVDLLLDIGSFKNLLRFSGGENLSKIECIDARGEWLMLLQNILCVLSYKKLPSISCRLISCPPSQHWSSIFKYFYLAENYMFQLARNIWASSRVNIPWVIFIWRPVHTICFKDPIFVGSENRIV